MRIFLGSPVLIQEAPEALRQALLAQNISVSDEDAVEATARMLGFDNMPEWLMMSEANPGSPLDHEISELEQEARRAFQARHLSGYLDVPPSIARSVVEAVEPSGSRRGEKRCSAAEISPDALNAIKHHVDASIADRMAEMTIECALEALVMLRPRVTSRLSLDACMSKDLPELSSLSHAIPDAAPSAIKAATNGWGILSFHVQKVISDLLAGPLDIYHPAMLEHIARVLRPIAQIAKLSERDLARAITLRRVPENLAHAFVSEAKQKHGSSKIKDLMYRTRNELGFYEWFPGIENTNQPQSELWRPLSLDIRNGDARGYKLTGEGYEFTVEVTRERLHVDGDDLRSYFVTADVQKDGKHLAVLRGHLLTCASPDYLTDEDLDDFAEAHSEELQAFCRSLVEEIDADELFEDGDVLIITHLEKAHGIAEPPGFGLSFLRQVIGILKKKHRRLGNIAYIVKPLQFRYPFDRRLPVRVTREFAEASSKIIFHCTEVAIRCGLEGRTLFIPPDMRHSLQDEYDAMDEMLDHIRGF